MTKFVRTRLPQDLGSTTTVETLRSARLGRSIHPENLSKAKKRAKKQPPPSLECVCDGLLRGRRAEDKLTQRQKGRGFRARQMRS